MKNNRKYVLGIIGAGQMGLGIALGTIRHEYLERYQICFYDPDPLKQKRGQMEGFALMQDEQDVAGNAHLVLVGVTSSAFPDVLKKLAQTEIDCLISVAAGYPTAMIQKIIGAQPVIRIMPNEPLVIDQGATAMCHSANINADDYDFVFQLLNAMGTARTVSEKDMDNVIAVHGSAPAYIYYLVDCLLQDAVKRGFDETTARSLLVQTVIGSGEMMARNPNKPLLDFVQEMGINGDAETLTLDYLKNSRMSELIHTANEKCIEEIKKDEKE